MRLSTTAARLPAIILLVIASALLAPDAAAQDDVQQFAERAGSSRWLSGHPQAPFLCALTGL